MIIIKKQKEGRTDERVLGNIRIEYKAGEFVL